jgi:pimeloyl-ACP methyl ester carboxylesterase
MAATAGNGTVYDISGPERAPVIALIHGLGLNRQVWQWHVPALSAHYRVLSYDLFGHGDSVPPPATPSLTLFSTQLMDLLDHLGIDSAAIVGFSLGGMINRRFALDHPKRTWALAILNSPHERSEEAQKAIEARAAQTAQGGSEATIDAAIERWFTREFRAARPEIIAMVRQWRMSNDPVSYPQSCEVLAKGVTELIRPQPPIKLPTLVMTAEYDSGSTPAMTHAIAAEIEGAQAIVVPGLRHMALTETPSQFTEPLLRFLDEALV